MCHKEAFFLVKGSFSDRTLFIIREGNGRGGDPTVLESGVLLKTDSGYLKDTGVLRVDFLLKTDSGYPKDVSLEAIYLTLVSRDFQKNKKKLFERFIQSSRSQRS
jgi:hypothetical protein